LIVYVEMVQSRWKKTKSGGIKAYMLWIMPFIIAFTVMMGIFPAPKKPYDWKFVKDAYHHIAEGLTMFSYNFLQADGEDFGMTMSGFSEDGDLRGGITDSDKEVMTVKGQTGLMTNVYLTGKVFDAFDGREWIAENESTEEERLLDTLETIYAVNCYESEHFRNYVYSTTIQIRYRYIKTGYLFAPLKTFTVWDRNSKLPFHEQGGNFVLDEKAGYGTGYDVQYYQMNVDHPEFYHFLEAERSEDEGVWKDLKKRYKYSDNSVIDRADMEVHKQKIYEHYLHDVTLSDDVKDYLSEVTTGAETDVERLKAIERALSGFTYSKQIGELPETVNNQEEFLDYFLLESKEGYCTYFATAFVLLAWEEGIPARYVQGFCVPIKKDEEKAVSSAMAHAWPEVYIDDVGWIPFEPTPGYDRIRYTPWEMQAGTESDENLVAGAGAGTHYWEEDNQPETVTEVQELEKLPEQEDGTGELFGTILLYTVLLVLLVCLIMLVVDGLVGRYRYKRQSLLEKYRIQVNKNLQILAMLGYERRAAETLQEFGGRAVWAMDDDVSQETLLFIGYYEELLYGKREVKEELLSVIANSRKLLLAELKKQKKRAYPIYRIKLYLNRKNML
jgi:transglutaminase-like putative cysteine protease